MKLRNAFGWVTACFLVAMALTSPARASDEAWRAGLEQAMARLSQQDAAGSLEILDRLEKTYPDTAEILFVSANVHMAVQKFAEAEDRLRRCIALKPKDLRTREQLLRLKLFAGDQDGYAAERESLLAVYRAAKEDEIKRSTVFIRQFFTVDKSTDVDAFEYYPEVNSKPLKRYFRFVLRGVNGADKGALLVGLNTDENADLHAAGKLQPGVNAYFMRHFQESLLGGSPTLALVTYFEGKEPPTYEVARKAAIDFVYGRLQPTPETVEPSNAGVK